jgi:hypothetical protein
MLILSSRARPPLSARHSERSEESLFSFCPQPSTFNLQTFNLPTFNNPLSAPVTSPISSFCLLVSSFPLPASAAASTSPPNSSSNGLPKMLILSSRVQRGICFLPSRHASQRSPLPTFEHSTFQPSNNPLSAARYFPISSFCLPVSSFPLSAGCPIRGLCVWGF